MSGATTKFSTQNRTKPTAAATTTAKKVPSSSSKTAPKTTADLKDKKSTVTGAKSKIPTDVGKASRTAAPRTAALKASVPKPVEHAASSKTPAAPIRKGRSAVPNAAATKAHVERRPAAGRASPATNATAKKLNVAEVKRSTAPKKPNAVLDNTLNVTVTTPPMPRKTESTARAQAEPTRAQVEPVKEREHVAEQAKRSVVRKGSRTLNPDEVLVLRRESAKKRLELHTRAEEQANAPPIRRTPVAFEVNFDDGLRPAPAKEASPSSGSEQADYSDDCESSFSSHEASANTSDHSSSDSEESEAESSSDNVSSDADASKASDKAAGNQSDDDDDESQVTPYPSTVIFRERKLDSGNYEMKSQKNAKHLSELSAQSSRQQFDSLDTISATTRSEHFDSGISNYSYSAPRPELHNSWAASYGGYADFYAQPIVNRRGTDLLAKIRQFDAISFTLFELKPASYEVYMQLYGNLNATQSSAQTTLENRMTRDCQTDDVGTRTVWTQHPALYDRQTVQRLAYGSGDEDDDNDDAARPVAAPLQLAVPHTRKRARRQQPLSRAHKPLAYARLNGFLLRSAVLLSKLFDAMDERPAASPQRALGSAAGRRFTLNTQVLSALRVVRVFASAGMVITVHESLPEAAAVYCHDFSNLLMVWSSSERSGSGKPLRLLSTWSEVCRAEICNDSADIVVCGLRDGSVALWNLQETHSYCSQLDGCLTHFAATQSIVPTHSGSGQARPLDLGATVDVRSFRAASRAVGVSTLIRTNAIQFATLHDCGLLSVWTLVRTAANAAAYTADASGARGPKATVGRPRPSTRFEHSSPWAVVKLMQSASCDLRDYLEQSTPAGATRSHFERTRALFQRNIGGIASEAAAALPGGGGVGQQTQGLRFTGLDVGGDCIYVCTNRNFVLACSRSLKRERLRKITVNESRFLFLTALCVLGNEDFVAVGLTNGAVMVINCSQHQAPTQAELEKHGDTEALQQSRQSALAAAATSSDRDLVTGKSCAIQNIILNEKRSLDGGDGGGGLQPEPDAARPLTAPRSAKSARRKRCAYESAVCDQQQLLSGCDLRANLVQSLQLSGNAERLFVLSNRRVRAYDFCREREFVCEQSDDVADMAVAGSAGLLLLNAQNAVELVQQLNQ